MSVAEGDATLSSAVAASSSGVEQMSERLESRAGEISNELSELAGASHATEQRVESQLFELRATLEEPKQELPALKRELGGVGQRSAVESQLFHRDLRDLRGKHDDVNAVLEQLSRRFEDFVQGSEASIAELRGLCAALEARDRAGSASLLERANRRRPGIWTACPKARFASPAFYGARHSQSTVAVRPGWRFWSVNVRDRFSNQRTAGTLNLIQAKGAKSMKTSSQPAHRGVRLTHSRRSRSTRRLRPELDLLEPRRLLSTFWWENPNGGDFNNPQNWQDQNGNPGVPGPGDTANVNGSGFTVGVGQSNAVDNLYCNAQLAINAGTFTVSNVFRDTTIGSLDLASGASFQVSGGTAYLTGNGSYAGTFDAQQGAVIIFAGGKQYLNAGASLTDTGAYVESGNSPYLIVNTALQAPQNFSLRSGADLYVAAGPLSFPGGSTWSWTGGILDGPGTTTVQSGATLSISGADTKYLEGDTVLVNDGTATWSDLGNIVINGGATINNDGSFTTTSNDTIGGSGMNFNNFGTFSKSIGSGGGVGDTTFTSGNFNNFNTVNGGDLVFDTSGDQDSGTWYAAPDSSISFDGYGSATLNAGTALTGTGAYVLGATSLRNDSNISVPNLFLMPGSYLYGDFSITVTAFMGWNGGTIAGPGAVDIQAGATMSISNSGNVVLDGTLNNAGTASWPGPAQIIGNSGSVINNTGTFNLSSDSSTSGIVFNNSGSLNSASPSGSGSTTFDNPLNNTGTVNVQSGSLLLEAGGSCTNGAYNVTAGAVLDLRTAAMWSSVVRSPAQGRVR
jgi:hypothetical protein